MRWRPANRCLRSVEPRRKDSRSGLRRNRRTSRRWPESVAAELGDFRQFSVRFSDLLRQIVGYLRAIARLSHIGSAQQLLFAISQSISNGLLHLRIRDFALAGRLFSHQFENVVAVLELDNRADLAHLENDHGVLQGRIALIQGRLRNISQIAARRGRRGIFRIVHGQLGEISAIGELLQQRRGFTASLDVGRGVVILSIVKLRIFMRGDQNLRDAVLGFRHVELRAVLIVEGRNVFVGDGDLCHHFTIQQLLHGKLLTDVSLEVVRGYAAILERPLEFIFGVGALEFREFVLDFAVGGLETQLSGTLDQDIVIDELVEDVESEGKRLFLGGSRRLRVKAALVVLFGFSAMNLFAIHHRPDVRGRRRIVFATGYGKHGNQKRGDKYFSYHVTTLPKRSLRRIKRPSLRDPSECNWCRRASACARHSPARERGAGWGSSDAAAHYWRG